MLTGRIETMRRFRLFFLLALVFLGGVPTASAENLKTFCSQTCSLWPKLCATATVCMKLCNTPLRLLKACRNNKVPVDTKLPEIPYTKQQFCQAICTQETLRCSVATYCIQACKTASDIINKCLAGGATVDSQRPQLIG